MSKITLIATAAFGIEAVVARELKKLGYTDQSVENTRVTFAGDENAICRTNLWLRTAGRILIKVGDFKATTFDQLFEGTKALPWYDWLPEDAEFPVDGRSVDSQLFSVSDCQAIVKKAIVEKMKLKYKRDYFDETGPKYRIEVSLLKDIATLTIDTSGSGLHKRGYRTLVAEAPLKETIACAMLQISYWNRDRLLVDPFCGSGTIPIEAAMIGMNIAPGLKREFASEKWGNIPKAFWAKAREEANDLIDNNYELHIQGSDINDDVMSLARYHSKLAGVEGKIHFQRMDMADLKSKHKYGVIVCNPPYGERMGETDEIEKLYKKMGSVFRGLDTWSYYVLTSYLGFEKAFGKVADKKRKLYNGKLLCNYYQYFGPTPPKRSLIRESNMQPGITQMDEKQIDNI